jgi:hypothetical protein
VNTLAVNRTQVLIITTVVLLLFAIIYHIWADWGLITIHARQEPLRKVLASMRWQGHADIQTDMPGDTPVTMDVVKVRLPDALETLSTVTDSRWRLLYFVAGDKATLKRGEATWFGGQRPDGWRMVSFPMGNIAQYLDDSDTPPPDPRIDLYTPRTAAPAPVQAFFAEAAQLTNAGFAFPADWNPTVDHTPPSGVVTRVIPKLIKYAHGRQDELFFLSKNNRRGPRGGGGGGDGAMADGFHFDPDLFAARIQAEISRLPDDERAEAQSNFNTEQAFRASLKDLSDEQRRAAWMQHMQDPAVQQAMANRMDGRDSRMNHDQREQHYSNYVSRKQALTGKM